MRRVFAGLPAHRRGNKFRKKKVRLFVRTELEDGQLYTWIEPGKAVRREY